MSDSGPEYVNALAREIADLQAVEPDASAPAQQRAAWYLRQANILDEIARVDPSRADKAQRHAELARRQAQTELSQQDSPERG